MEIIYPDEFIEFINENKDIDSPTEINLTDETYDYPLREDSDNPTDDYDDYNFDESYNYINDYDYNSYDYLSNYDYRDSEDDSSKNTGNDDKKDPLIKNQLVKIKIPYIDVRRLRPPFPPFTPWQGPWWPWNWPWSSHYPWNYPWSMHKNDCCDSHGHCHCGSKHPRENYDDKEQRTYNDDNYASDYDVDYEDIDLYNDISDDIRTMMQPGGGQHSDFKPPSAPPPPKVPSKNAKDVMILSHDGPGSGTSTYGPTHGGPGGPGGPGHGKYISPGYLRRCMFRLIYVWEINGRGYWAYLTRVDRNFVSGWRWMGRRWTPFRQNIRRIDSILCNAR
ncbi:MAG: hypothetical protein Q4B63_04705 [Clostridium perfringens]|nr:hypothetical protein [Clostridium perfringens]